MKRRHGDINAIRKVLQHIGVNAGVAYKTGQEQYPDETVRNEKACDMLTELGEQKLAVEHTTIDSVPDQRKDDSYFVKVLGPLEAELDRQLAFPGRYQLCIAMNVIPSGKGVVWNEIREEIKQWCIKVSSGLNMAPGDRRATGHYVSERPEGIPFDVCLYRWKPLGGFLREGRFTIARHSPEEMDSKREESVRVALQNRTPKLCQYSSQGYRTVLILELKDFALSSLYDIGRAFRVVTEKEKNIELPDEVYAVETIENPLFVQCLKFNSGLFPEAMILVSTYNGNL